MNILGKIRFFWERWILFLKKPNFSQKNIEIFLYFPFFVLFFVFISTMKSWRNPRLSFLFFAKIINFQVNHRHSVKISQKHLINLVSFFENGVYEPYSITLFGFDVASKSRVSLRRTNWTTQNGRILFSAMLRSVEVWYRVFKKCCDSWSSGTMRNCIKSNWIIRCRSSAMHNRWLFLIT